MKKLSPHVNETQDDWNTFRVNAYSHPETGDLVVTTAVSIWDENDEDAVPQAIDCMNDLYWLKAHLKLAVKADEFAMLEKKGFKRLIVKAYLSGRTEEIYLDPVPAGKLTSVRDHQRPGD